MTTTQPSPGADRAGSAAQAIQSTGFEITERLLREYQSGRSTTVEAWSNHIRQRLARFRASNPDARSTKEAALVERSVQLALELLQDLRREKKP